ncbi:ankyrin repeat-containing protein ITN1 [Vigna radiata var. radiata]|uniref:Ankyrin repeat-containing protein ITN1 n=1 Tax=Vigna radiata var. radiata TaxID=3916 RepID=A0A1S3UQJ2_VIGRR|nr:ankyrin repeat-containing protein ITN1 [Vigna radiata var. radiata]
MVEIVEIESLFNYAMKGQWREVLEAYKNNPRALEAKVTKAEDTVLHIAVYVGQTNFLTTLLDNINENLSLAILNIPNSKGNTPLHLAAELGNVDICNTIAKRDPNLIFCQNFEGETPLYLAAIHGSKDAFFCLHAHLQNKHDYSPCIKTNGDTILHSTISNEYFGLALQIIRLYPNLADAVNQDGYSPLHILAMKPNCFRSSTWMEFMDRMIYNCLLVDELKEDTEEDRSSNKGDTQILNYPTNYETCFSFLYLLKNAAKVITIGTKDSKTGTDDDNDEENLQGSSNTKCVQEGAKKEKKLHRFPPNWEVLIRFLIIMMKAILILFGVGSSWIDKIQRRKEKHMWAKKVMDELIERASLYKYDYTENNSLVLRRDSDIENKDNEKKKGIAEKRKRVSPILIAAKMGVNEMIEKILDTFPVAIHDVDSENKNVVLLAIENRQPRVYKMLKKRNLVKESAFRHIDNQGNSALHLAATYKEHRPWRVPGAAMQMQWEYKWYKLVKNSMPPNFYARYNNKGQTAKQVFMNSHEMLVKEGRKWLSKTSESCTLVAALVATVAFTTSTAIPGGTNDDTGEAVLNGQPGFKVFALASLVALCSSVTALVLFLSILTSRFQEKDVAMHLPKKLLLGMTSLWTSIASILVSFCAGHYFIIEEGMKSSVYLIYGITCLPVTFFVLVQLPLYLDLTLGIFRKVPQRVYKVFSH